MSSILPSVLTVAGSDSGGGAGIQADLRTFNAFKVYGCSVITAVTSQNPDEVRRVDVLSEEAVKTQIETVMQLFPVRFAKTGMLANERIIACTALLAEKYDLQLVVDPVMVSTSGAKLLEESAISAMRELLFPRAQWITPNIPEAELLCGRKFLSSADLVDSAAELYEKFKCNVILKSGHATGVDHVTDIVCCEGKLYSLSTPVAAVRGNSSHGTGCTLSAAITALLASGKSWQESLQKAKAFVYGSLLESRPLNETFFQMYPPEKQYSDKVSWEEL